MPPRSQLQKKRWDFDNPDEFPTLFSSHVSAIKNTKQIMDRYAALFGNLASFNSLTNQSDRLRLFIDEIQDWIKKYLDQEINFNEVEDGMKNYLSQNLTDILDTYPIPSFEKQRTGHQPLISNGAIASPSESDEDWDPPKYKGPTSLEDTLIDDIEEVILRAWESVLDEGYKLHTAMIRA